MWRRNHQKQSKTKRQIVKLQLRNSFKHLELRSSIGNEWRAPKAEETRLYKNIHSVDDNGFV